MGFMWPPQQTQLVRPNMDPPLPGVWTIKMIQKIQINLLLMKKWSIIKQRYLFRRYTIHIQTLFFNIFYYFIQAIKQNFIQHITNVVPYYLYFNLDIISS